MTKVKFSANNGRASKKTRGKGYKRLGKARDHTTWKFPSKLTNEKVILHSVLDQYSVEFYDEIVSDMKSLITSLVRNHGFTDGSKRYKTIQNYTVDLIEGKNPSNPGWLATSRTYRVPSSLGQNFVRLIVDYLNCTEVALQPKYYRVIITTLNIVRAVKGLADADFESVISRAQPIDDKLLNDFNTYVEEKLRPYKYQQKEVNLWKYRFHLSKNGPNGEPKAESALREALYLHKSKLYNPFKRVCEELGCKYLYDYLDTLVTSPEVLESCKDAFVQSTLLRKLVKVPDSGFKTRIVAIVDFWTQLVLEPLRGHVQEVTKRLFDKTDFRLDQDRGVNAMVEFQSRCLKSDFVSHEILDVKHLKFYDISSWTDRFHRDLQVVVMRNLFSPRLAEAWKQLVVTCEWYSPDLKRTIKYGQGQGMGTNGSFDVATLTDHLFINFIYDRVYDNDCIYSINHCYGKVGDDLWIYDPKDYILEYYGKINLPINLSKSKTFNGKHSIAEFCARTFMNTVDVSRISPVIINRSKDFRHLPALLALCAQRGIQLDSSSFTYLQNNLVDSDITYLDKLQEWIIGLITISKFEQSSYFQSLTLDYLQKGNWLSGNDLLSRFMVDQEYCLRLTIVHFIMKIAKAQQSIQTKVSETQGGMKEWGDEINLIANNDSSNLFDPSNIGYQTAFNAVSSQQGALLPKQIIVLGRYVDQRRLISEGAMKLFSDASSLDTEQRLLKLARELEEIATKSCYDNGNINYDSKRVFNTQFEIVKTLQSGNEDLTEFILDESYDIDLIYYIQGIIGYDDLGTEWGVTLPSFEEAE
jgi:hypothetical protein